MLVEGLNTYEISEREEVENIRSSSVGNNSSLVKASRSGLGEQKGFREMTEDTLNISNNDTKHSPLNYHDAIQAEDQDGLINIDKK